MTFYYLNYQGQPIEFYCALENTELFDIDWTDVDDDGSQTYKSVLLEPNSITGQF